jgi:hypothetical protein
MRDELERGELPLTSARREREQEVQAKVLAELHWKWLGIAHQQFVVSCGVVFAGRV